MDRWLLAEENIKKINFSAAVVFRNKYESQSDTKTDEVRA